MTKTIHIRPEKNKDIDQISNIIFAAFEHDPHGNQTEHKLVIELRKYGALEVSLVAERKGKVVGHIAFSKVSINNKDLMWFGLAPVSVDPNYQNQGIGVQLINSGLQDIQKRGGKGCVLLGDPNYYNRFEFYPVDGLILQGVPSQYFMARSFDGNFPSGEVKYHSAFENM